MLKIDNAVLVVVDVQGKLATLMYEKEKFFDNVVRMIEGCKALEIPIIWNEQLPDKLGETISMVKDVLGGHTPLIKKTFSCVGNEEFVRALTELDRHQVILVGMESHVCVYQTAMDLIQTGFEVYPAADCISSRTLENKQIGLGAMSAAGAKITSLEMALFEMLGVAEGDKFKQAIRIIK